jgi:DinB superfamily
MPAPTKSLDQDKSLRQHLVKLLKGGEAHATFQDAVANMPQDAAGKIPQGAEHSPWQELEHLRIAQWDILEFAINGKHKSPKWPDEYWPKSPEPPNPKAWEKSVASFEKDHQRLIDLISDSSPDLHAKIPHGDGQTVLRQALITADHNAYHVGQLVLLRRLLGAWKS